MRFSVLACHAVLAGSAAVSALPAERPQTKAQFVDLKQFGRFMTKTIDEALSTAQRVNTTKFDWSSIKDSDTASYGSRARLAARQDASCASPAVRVEWRSLPDADRTSFVDAVKCLMDLPASGAYSDVGAKTRWDDLVAVHYKMTDTIHGVAQFLQWHRYYLHIFEDLLRTECSYQAPLPWWDETRDAGHFSQAPMYTAAWMGSAPVANNGRGTCLANGAFAGYQLSVGGTQCLSRGVDESATAQCNSNFVNTCNAQDNYSDMESCSEMGPHAFGHNGMGAIMAGVPTSPNDPAFFLHHSFVDHMYRIWQIADPENRLMQINGCADKSSPCAAINADFVLTSLGLRPDMRLGDSLDTTGGAFCYRYDY